MTAPEVDEEVVDPRLDAATERLLAHVGESAILNPGGTLVTVSLWRPEHRDLVRVYTSMPGVYRLGGISSGLGDDWVKQCVIDQESFVADDDEAVNSDAFEHHDVLAALGLGAAINAVIVSDGVFLGCLNVLGPAGAYPDRRAALAETDRLAAILAEPTSRNRLDRICARL